MPACRPCRFSRVWLFVTLWTIAHQAPLSMGFSRQEYWSGGLPWGSASHCRGRWLYPWSRRVPRAAERLCPYAVATEPVLWGPRATHAEPMCLDSAPQLGRPPQRGACTPQLERIPHTAAKTQNSQKRRVSSQLKKKKYYRNGLPCPPAGDLPDPGIKPMSHLSCIGRRVLYCWCPLGSPLHAVSRPT